jgi:hypothetical protein
MDMRDFYGLYGMLHAQTPQFKTHLMTKQLLLIALPFVFSACVSENPGTQCLNSFKSTLKDPDSGKIISFDAPTLKYSATNSYGARTQGKALCTQNVDGKWVRDHSEEYLAILRLSKKKLDASNVCLKAGGTGLVCAGDSFALRQAAISQVPTNLDKLHEESTVELGF